jgi:hypothetical protein
MPYYYAGDFVRDYCKKIVTKHFMQIIIKWRETLTLRIKTYILISQKKVYYLLIQVISLSRVSREKPYRDILIPHRELYVLNLH